MSNKDGTNQKAEFMAMIEAAKSKMHQVYMNSYTLLLGTFFLFTYK